MKIPTSDRGFGVRLLPFLIGLALVSSLFDTCQAKQTEEVQAAEAAQKGGMGMGLPTATLPGAVPAEPTVPNPDEPADESTDMESTDEKTPQISDQFATLHLRDGSIIGGELETKTIDVKTNFGMLTIPIARIVRMYPGLKSTPELNQKISQLVENLGAGEMATRDAAQTELASMGVKIHNILSEYGDGGNAERKKRLGQIRAAFDEILQEEMDGNTEGAALLSYDDRIVTPDFAIIGKIQQQEFRVASKYGDLNVKLGDLKLADRQMATPKSEIRKTVSVPAMAFFQKEPKSTGIRVNKGDKITIVASGVVQWTNWNNSSSPEGLTNRSNWNGINSGKLTARIGTDNSKCVAIGQKESFVATSSGKLYLGIAMRDSYANSSNYRWSGEYKAKVRINPKSD
jgi:hypothetical protein